MNFRNDRKPKFKAILKAPGPLGYPPVYRYTQESAVNKCYETATNSASPYLRAHGQVSCLIEIWERELPKTRAHAKWNLHSTLNIYGTRYLGKYPGGREFGGILPLPKE